MITDDLQTRNQNTAYTIALFNRDDGNGSVLDKMFVLLDVSQDETVPLESLLIRKLNLKKDQNEKLTYRNIFATALCLELALLKEAFPFAVAYKAYCNTLKIMEKNKTYHYDEKNGNDSIELPSSFQTTQGYIFFYRIAGKFLKNNFTNIILDEDEWRIVEEGRQAEEEEVRVLADELMQVKLHASNNKTLSKRSPITMKFLFSLSELFNEREALKEAFSSFPSSARLWNALIEFQRNELAHNGSFRHYPAIIETIDACIHQWLETCDLRLVCFSDNLENIKRNAPTKGRIKYLKQYATHDIDLIVETPISNYVERCKAFQLSLRSEMDLDICESKDDESIQEKPQFERVSEALKGKKKKPEKLERAKIRKIDRTQKVPIKASEAPVKAPISARVPAVAPQNKASSIAEKFPYSPRVIDWFNAQPRQLSGESYVELPLALQKKQHLFHGFSRLVDNYILKFGFQSTWHNPTTNHQDILYAAPGEIKTGGEIHRGLFIYTIGIDGKTYHRYFTIRPEEELMRLAYSSFDLVDFPTIEQAEKLSRLSFEMQEAVEVAANATVRHHPIFGSVHITDHIHDDAELVLYPNLQR